MASSETPPVTHSDPLDMIITVQPPRPMPEPAPPVQRPGTPGTAPSGPSKPPTMEPGG